ncbi:MAG: hypothetical protein IMW84_05615 [Thermoanaerobacter sp.]|nr:hypothetical protein [Thermoanaerobacter sp.]
MKKFFLMVFALIFIATGCYNVDNTKVTENKSPKSGIEEIKIPFFVYTNESDNKYAARLCYWDLNNVKVNLTEEMVYVSEDRNFLTPVFWDGDSRIVLRKTSYPTDEYKDRAEIVKSNDMNTVYGKDIKAKRNLDNNSEPIKKVKSYTLYLHNGSDVVEKDVSFLYKTKDDKGNDITVGEYNYPCFIDYDRKTGDITFIFSYPFDTHTNVYIAKSNVDSIDKISWEEVKLPGGGVVYTPSPYNTMLIGSKYYIQCFKTLCEVDLKGKKVTLLDDVAKECRSIVREGDFKADYSKDIKPVGKYKDVLILSLPVSTDTNVEPLICALKDNKLLGAIHPKSNDMWDIIGPDKKVASSIDVKDKNLYKEFNADLMYFPNLETIE